MTAFGDLLRAVRERAGVCQDDLAQRLGVPAKLVREWEEGMRTPRVLDVAPLRDVLGEDVYVALIRALTRDRFG